MFTFIWNALAMQLYASAANIALREKDNKTGLEIFRQAFIYGDRALQSRSWIIGTKTRLAVRSSFHQMADHYQAVYLGEMPRDQQIMMTWAILWASNSSEDIQATDDQLLEVADMLENVKIYIDEMTPAQLARQYSKKELHLPAKEIVDLYLADTLDRAAAKAVLDLHIATIREHTPLLCLTHLA